MSRYTRKRQGFHCALHDTGFGCRVGLQRIRRYDFGVAILFIDMLMLPWALGHDLTYLEGEGPVLRPLLDAADVMLLDSGRVLGGAALIMETVWLVWAGLHSEGFGHTTLIGFGGSPLTVACYVVEGEGGVISRQRAAWPIAISPGSWLLDVLLIATTEYLSTRAESGAKR